MNTGLDWIKFAINNQIYLREATHNSPSPTQSSGLCQEIAISVCSIILHCQDYHFTADKRDAKLYTRYVKGVPFVNGKGKGLVLWAEPSTKLCSVPPSPHGFRGLEARQVEQVCLPVCIKFGMSCTRTKRCQKKIRNEAGDPWLYRTR